MAAKTLEDMGLPKVSHIDTGLRGWRDAGQPVIDYEQWKSERAKRGE